MRSGGEEKKVYWFLYIGYIIIRFNIKENIEILLKVKIIRDGIMYFRMENGGEGC